MNQTKQSNHFIQRTIIAILAFGVIWGAGKMSLKAAGAQITLSSDGNFYYMVNGVVDTSRSGLVQLNKKWYYLESGQWMTKKYAFVDFGGSKFLVANGVVATDKMGLMQDPENKDDWYFVTNGQVTTKKSGLVQYPANTNNWFFVENGKLDTTYNGFVSYNGGLFFVARGKLQNTKNGLTQDPNNKSDWYFLANGQAQLSVSSLVLYDGAWFYVVEGKLVPGYTGVVEYNGASFRMVNGVIQTEQVGAMQSGFVTVPKMTAEEIRAEYNQIVSATYPLFDVEPSVTAPYTTGKVSDQNLQYGLAATNLVRKIGGVYPVVLCADYCENAQYAAVIGAANLANGIRYSHTPGRPAGMSDDFYNKAYEACSNCNLHGGFSNIALSVFSYMKDKGESNVSKMGHRRWILNPYAEETGFGYTTSSTTMFVKQVNLRGQAKKQLPDYDFISWPSSGAFPSDFISMQDVWCITANPNKYKTSTDVFNTNNLVVTITSPDGKSQTLSGAIINNAGDTTSPYFGVNDSNYGSYPALIFRPGTSVFETKTSGTYYIKITGLYDLNGNPAVLDYQVNFFDL